MSGIDTHGARWFDLDGVTILPLYSQDGALTTKARMVLIKDKLSTEQLQASFNSPGLHIDGPDKWFVIELELLRSDLNVWRKSCQDAADELEKA